MYFMGQRRSTVDGVSQTSKQKSPSNTRDKHKRMSTIEASLTEQKNLCSYYEFDEGTSEKDSSRQQQQQQKQPKQQLLNADSEEDEKSNIKGDVIDTSTTRVICRQTKRTLQPVN